MGEDGRESLLKVVVCGDGASGKTSLCMRFAHDAFDNNYHQTLGLDFFSRRVVLPGEVAAVLQVWDVGGQSIASSMIEKYLFGAHAVLVVYDITNSASFDNVSEWVATIKRILKGADKLPVMSLVGNKTDLEFRRSVRLEKHATFATDHEMLSHYVCAKTGDSVLLMFRQTAATVLGIPFTKPDVEQDIVPIPAEVSAAAEIPRRRPQQMQTTVCSLM